MVAGQFLFDKKAAGGLEGFDFEAPAKSITEGDISVTFAGASDGASNAESRFDAMLSNLMHPAESTLPACPAAYPTRRSKAQSQPMRPPWWPRR